MATRRGKETPCTGREARNRVATATAYQELAKLRPGDSTGAARNAAAGNAVLAGIAAADAICCLRLGGRSASTDHSDAVALLARVDTALSRHLATLVGNKGLAHLGDTFIGPGALSRSIRAMDHLVAAANAMVHR
ncbi:MAG: hypothetical protein ACRDWY_09300 [Actinomycetes bacterium]